MSSDAPSSDSSPQSFPVDVDPTLETLEAACQAWQDAQHELYTAIQNQDWVGFQQALLRREHWVGILIPYRNQADHWNTHEKALVDSIMAPLMTMEETILKQLEALQEKNVQMIQQYQRSRQSLASFYGQQQRSMAAYDLPQLCDEDDDE